MTQIVECVPNFSEGRRPQVIDSIVDALRQVAGLRLLDVSSDAHHNRTVVTLAGPPAVVSEAAFRAIATAARLIDLDEQRGEHPRLGATDVCPFVPIAGVTMAECVALAQALGRRVGSELGIAVYLYGRAALRPDRVRLAAIRRGEYEGWKATVATDPDRLPDFGPARPASWGATTIGARPLLIAYNLYLNSADVDQARQIAGRVRQSSGGLTHVQARGFLVDGQAQVSLNLTDFRRTPIHRAQELVRREAAHLGLTITRAELVGLVPEAAVWDAARWYLQLDSLDEAHILEQRLAAAAEVEPRIPHAFVAAVAAAAPTPGGGAVSALAATLAAALTEMVAGLTVGRKAYAAADDAARAVLARAAALRAELSAAVAADGAAYSRWLTLVRERSAHGAERAALLEHGRQAICVVPLQVARLSREVASLARTMVELGLRSGATDAAVAGLMARAAAQAAALNVKTNVVGLSDRALAASWVAEVETLVVEVEADAAVMVEMAAVRAGFGPGAGADGVEPESGAR